MNIVELELDETLADFEIQDWIDNVFSVQYPEIRAKIKHGCSGLCKKDKIDWHTPEEEPVPFGKYINERYPQIPCLVDIKNYGYGVRYWNVKEKCWDGEDCDDYYCDMDKVRKWSYIKESE